MSSNPPNEVAYLARMRLIQRWRRIANLVWLFLALYALLSALQEPEPLKQPHMMLVGSLFAFLIAVVIAVNVLTFLLRR